MKEIWSSILEFERRAFPNAVLDRLKREFVGKGWKVKLIKFKADSRFTDENYIEDPKIGRLRIMEELEEQLVREEVGAFYIREGYEVKEDKRDDHRLELHKDGDVYWAMVMGLPKEVDVYVFRSPMIRIKESFEQKLVLGGI